MTKRKSWHEKAKPKLNFKAFLKFVKEARKEHRNRDFEALKVSLTQARGRINNILEELEENGF